MTREPGGIPEDPDPGVPIGELAGYEMPTSDGFTDAVRDRLDAREGGIQVAEFSLGGLGEVVRVYFILFLQFVSRSDRSRE